MVKMDILWAVLFGVLLINFKNIKSNTIDTEIESTKSPTDYVTDTTTTTVEDRHTIAVFPKLSKKFVVTLEPPIKSYGYRVSPRRRIAPSITIQQLQHSSNENTQNTHRQPFLKKMKFVVNEHSHSNSRPFFIKKRERIRNNKYNKSPIVFEEKVAKNDTVKESNDMFQTDTFAVFDNSSLTNNTKENKDILNNKEVFDASEEVNTMPSMLSDESNSNEESNESKAAKDILPSKSYSEETLKQSNDYSKEEDADKNEFLFEGSHIKSRKTGPALNKQNKIFSRLNQRSNTRR